MRGESLMGYAYNVTLPAAGSTDYIPINVTGQTQLTAETVYQLAYDENGFSTNQFSQVIGTQGQLVLNFAEPTVLWVRQNPDLAGAPATVLYVWTDIGGINV